MLQQPNLVPLLCVWTASSSNTPPFHTPLATSGSRTMSSPQSDNQQTEAAATAAASLIAQPVGVLPSEATPHLRLHRHALESIFGLLSFDELCLVIFVSHRWLAAVYSMHGLVKGRTLRLQEQISDALPSRLARHVTSIGDIYGVPLLNRAQVQLIASRMPFLRELSFGLQDDELWSAEEHLSLPATLTDVTIRFDTSAASVNSVLAAFSQQDPLARLELIEWSEQMSIAPLQSLPALQTLRIDCNFRRDVAFTPAQVHEVRSLTQLTRLDCGFSEQTLLQMLQPPHQLGWTELPQSAPYHISADVAALLPSLKHLRTFTLARCCPSLRSLDFLAQLPALTEVDIDASNAMRCCSHSPSPCRRYRS